MGHGTGSTVGDHKGDGHSQSPRALEAAMNKAVLLSMAECLLPIPVFSQHTSTEPELGDKETQISFPNPEIKPL